MTKTFWIKFGLLFLVGGMAALIARQGLHIPLFNLFPDTVSAREPAKQLPADNTKADAPSGIATITKNLAADHGANDSLVCGRPVTKSRTDTGNTTIYRWTDHDGVTHMADKAPANTVASVLDLSGSLRDFTYRIEENGVTLPMPFSGQIAAGSKRIFDIWHFLLGEDRLRQVTITLRILEPNRFDALWADQSPGAAPVSGFYTMRSNTAYVRYDPERQEDAIATSFHEISHLITASHLGVTPPWLTEGLAEYAETMKVTDQKAVISPSLAHLQRLKSGNLPPLDDFLAMDRATWNGAKRGLNYAIAWSLTHHLMSTDIGRTALRSLTREANDKFCKPFSAAAALASAYPGGLARLEADWRARIHNGTFGIHQT